MEPGFVRTLYDYNAWAWKRLLAAARHLPAGGYAQANSFTYGSLQGILLHSLWAEVLWLARWERAPIPAEITPEDAPTLEPLLDRWSSHESRLQTFVNGLTSERLAAAVTYQSTRTGKTYSEPLWQLMVHVANHATQHRSEAAEALTMAGPSPGDLDLLDFFREQAAGA